MYEEYQTNPNPGFDRRSRYEDAGGYLRSILGSFLSQKKESEDKAWEEKKFQETMRQAEEQAEANRKANDPVTQYAEASAYADMQGATGMQRDILIDRILSGREDTYSKILRGAYGRNDVLGQFGAPGTPQTDYVTMGPEAVTKKDVAETAAGAKTAVANTQAGSAAQVATIKANTPSKAAPPKAPKPENPNKLVDSFIYNNAESVIGDAVTQMTKNAHPDAAKFRYLLKTIVDFRKLYGAGAALSEPQKAILSEIASKGMSMDSKAIDDVVARLLATVNQPQGPTGSTGPGLMSGSGQERVLNIGGKRYLEDANGDMYEMVMG